MGYRIKNNRIVFENGRAVMADESNPEGFGMVDTLIKLGIDAETGNQIISTTINLDADRKRAVIDNLNAMSGKVSSVDATQTAQNNLGYVIKDNRIVFENGRAVMADKSNPEIFGMVDTLIKLGVDAETGSQIVNATRGQSTERQAVIAAMSVLSDSRPFVDAAQRMAAYDTLCENLSQLNTMRGGVKGFKGFVGEHMQAADYTATGRFTRVVDDNGAIDLIFEGKNGHQYPYQLKIGYKPGQIDFVKYKGQTVVVDKGNPYLREFQAEGARHGVKVVEGTVTKAETEWWAKACQFERKITHEITGKKTAYFIPQVQRAGNYLSAMHTAGKQVGKTGALYGAGFSIGRNIVGMMRGDVSAGEAIDNVARDTAVSYGVGYATGAVGSAVARTAAGKAVAAAAGEIGTAISGTAVGGAVTGVVGSATAAVGGMAATATAGAVGAIGSAGAAVGGALTAATAGTAVGGAVATGVAGATAAGAVLGAAAVAAAPVVAVGAVVGGIASFIGGLFD